MKFASILFAAAVALLQQGRTAMDKRDFQGAVDILEKAVAAEPSNAEAHYLLGGAYGRLAQQASIFRQMSLAGKAKDELEKAVQLDPNYIDARMGLMEYYMMAPGIAGGSDEKAAQQAAEIKKRDSYEGHRAYASLALHNKNNDAARKEYVDAVREQPASPKTHYGLGNFYLSIDKNNAAALHEYEQSITLDPNYMPGWFQIGHVAALTGNDTARGEQSLRKYLAYTPKENEPGLHRAHYWLGMIFEKQGKKAEAKQEYAASLKINPDQKDVKEAAGRV